MVEGDLFMILEKKMTDFTHEISNFFKITEHLKWELLKEVKLKIPATNSFITLKR